ncbi:deoxyuridine 5'-triphosphate nucleotidohydrolase, mitochondrial isoform X2 [Castor canadensis]|uniref:Deoxyuridine 5'-triphosphate nucleotidohydrolase, mitochondrial isoform X2 n=1 Tax=Castor canadensis TaxID=51338 RepID=A0AC58LXV8_CASCN
MRPELPTSAAPKLGAMSSLRPRLVLHYRFLSSLLRSVLKDTAGISGRSPDPGATRLGSPGSLYIAGRLSLGCRGAKLSVVSPSKRTRPAEEGGMRLRFVRLSEHATAPTRGSSRAAGYDLYSAYDYTVPSMEKALVKTDIQIALPSGCYGRVAGVIDEDYRGNVGVILFNFGKEKFEVKKGDRIAQLICERIFYPEIEEVQVLDDTERGSGGFGSTGKN